MHGLRNVLQFFFDGEPIRADALGAMFDLLKKAGDADFDEFVEIVGGDGQKFDAFKKRIAVVASLIEHTLIEGQPLEVAVQVKAMVIERNAFHGSISSR